MLSLADPTNDDLSYNLHINWLVKKQNEKWLDHQNGYWKIGIRDERVEN